MNIDELVTKINEFAASFSWGPLVILVLGLIGSACVVATVVVGLSPTKKDDELLAKLESGSVSGLIWKALCAFSLIRKK